MTRDDIIRMAREAGGGTTWWPLHTDTLERFAAIVAEAERNRKWTQDHWTEYERSIASAEREACAKVCDDWAKKSYLSEAKGCAVLIRARGNK